MAPHQGGRGCPAIVRWRKNASNEGSNTKRRKVVAGDELPAQRLCRLDALTSPHTELRSPGLKSSQIFKLRCVSREALIDAIREQPPATIVRPGLYAAIVVVAYANQPSRVTHRDPLAHDRMTDRK